MIQSAAHGRLYLAVLTRGKCLRKACTAEISRVLREQAHRAHGVLELYTGSCISQLSSAVTQVSPLQCEVAAAGNTSGFGRAKLSALLRSATFGRSS